MAQGPPNGPPSPPVGPTVSGQPPLPPGHGGIMVWLPPAPESRWLRMLRRAPDFRVDRKRTRAKRPVTFLIAPAGLRRLQLREVGGPGELVSVQAEIDVRSGQWRQLTIGEGAYPPLLDERGVNVNTATPPGCRRAILGLLGFLAILAGFVAACLFGPHLLDRL